MISRCSMMFYDFSIQHQSVAGAGGDLQQVERMARAMVTQFGMSDVGPAAQLVTGNLELKTLGTRHLISTGFLWIPSRFLVISFELCASGRVPSVELYFDRLQSF